MKSNQQFESVMIKPKFDCKFIFKYYKAILKELDFLKVLNTIANSESGGDAKKLDNLMIHFYDNLANTKMSNLIDDIPPNKADELCSSCKHKHKYTISRECREWFSPIRNR